MDDQKDIQNQKDLNNEMSNTKSFEEQIIDLLKSIQDKYELTYLFISHDLKVIRSVSDSIFVMQDGNLVESGLADEVFNNPKKDYTNKLLTAALKYATN